MSHNELVSAYQAGKLSRRSFIRGMTALGLSVAAANHLADSNAVEASSAHGGHGGGKHHDDIYDHHHHHHHKPRKGSTATVTTLPATGEGNALTESSSASTLKTLGLLGTAAAAAATIFRRGSRTAPDSE